MIDEAPRSKGAGIRHSLIQWYMKNHVVVPANKDSNTVFKNLSTYQHGLMQHLQSPKGGALISE